MSDTYRGWVETTGRDQLAELERLRKVEQSARALETAIGQWAGIALSPEVAKAYGALCDALDGISA